MTTFTLLMQLLLLGTLSWFGWVNRSRLKRFWGSSWHSTGDSAPSSRSGTWLRPGSALRTTVVVDVIEVVYCDGHAQKSVVAAYHAVSMTGEFALCQHCAHVHVENLRAQHYHLMKIPSE